MIHINAFLYHIIKIYLHQLFNSKKYKDDKKVIVIVFYHLIMKSNSDSLQQSSIRHAIDSY